MFGVDETMAALARARTSGSGRYEPGDDAGMTEIRGFGFNPGELRMLAYIPQDLPLGAPLIVVLHGCTQRAGAHARAAGWLQLADRLGFAVLAPEQTAANNPNRCFNWFEPADTARGSGECASIHAMTAHIVRREALDPDRVFVTGLSAGGAMASALLAAYPESFAGGAVIAGLPFGARNVQEALSSMRQATRLSGRALRELVIAAAPPPPRWPRLSIWHGDADATVAIGNAAALARQWSAVHGLADQPHEVRKRGGRTRSVWRGFDGEPLIELNVLKGLGHGTPLATSGKDPIGQVAPFMIEAGVSSSSEIARFWGLAPASTADWEEVVSEPEAQVHAANSLGQRIVGLVSAHVPADVERTITSALRSAGLMGP